MVDSRAKGAKAETVIRDLLRSYTKLQWERTPGSGALDEKHGLKGDLYVPKAENTFCVEVKHYEDDHLTSAILTHKDPQLIDWWNQTIRQSKQVGRKPLLIFKFNRSKVFVAFDELPTFTYRTITIHIGNTEFFVSLLEDWINNEQPKFIK
jgi:hypothetical protein